MKKVIIVIICFCVLIAMVCFIVGSNPYNDVSNILESDISTFEKGEKINNMIEAKISECEKIKKDIIVLLDNLYSESEIYGTYFSKEEIIESFNLYYTKSFDKINSQTDFDEYMSVLKYLSGTEASLEILTLKYDHVFCFYEELNDMYLYLGKTGDGTMSSGEE